MFFKVYDYKLELLSEFNSIYNDCYLYPSPKVNWDKIADNLKKHSASGGDNIGIIQYNHPRIKLGINQDLGNIVKFRKDIQENMDKTRKFLNKLDKRIDLKTPQYYENTVLGFYLKDKKVIRFQKHFWANYLKSDQLLCSFRPHNGAAIL